MVYPVNTDDFQFQAVHRVNKQHLQLGLRKGMAVLVYYRVQWGPHAQEVFQAVLIAHESATNRGKKSDNQLWKRVVPSETEFAWLPLRLPGLFVVMPFVGEGTANIWLSMKPTWGCRDAPSRPTSSLLICVSLVTQEVPKSLLSSPIWPLRDFVWVVDYG